MTYEGQATIPLGKRAELTGEGGRSIALGERFSCALRRGGAVSCWGFVPDEAGLIRVPDDAPVVVEE